MSLKSVEFNTDRNHLLDLFADRFTWLPHWGAEVTMAVEGLESHISQVDRFAGSLAIISTLAEADKYRTEAQNEIDDLEIPVIHKRGIYPVKFDAIHGDQIVINAMARHLLFKDSLPRDKWPIHTEPQFGRKVKPYSRLVKNLSSVRRTGLWHEALKSETTRNLFWIGSLLDAHGNPKVKDAIDSQKKEQDSVVAEIA